MLRLVWSPEYVDIDPDDPHNVLLGLGLGFGLGFGFGFGFGLGLAHTWCTITERTR